MNETIRDACNLNHLGEFDLEPVDDDHFDEREWAAIVAEFGVDIPHEMDLFVRKCGGHNIAAPIGFYEPEPDVTHLVDHAYGTTYMRRQATDYASLKLRQKIIPILSSPELVYVCDGNFAGCLVEDLYFKSGEHLKPNPDPNLWEIYPADKFFGTLVYDWDFNLSDTMRPRDMMLALSAMRGEWEKIETEINAGFSIDSPLDSDGTTLLWYAACANRADIVDRLIQIGANPDRLMSLGSDEPRNPMSAIVGVAGRGVNIQAAKALLRGGASVGREVSNQHPWFDKDELPRKAMLDLLKSYGFKE